MKDPLIEAQGQSLQSFCLDLRTKVNEYNRGLGTQCKEKLEARRLENIAKDMDMMKVAMWIRCMVSTIHAWENVQKMKKKHLKSLDQQ